MKKELWTGISMLDGIINPHPEPDPTDYAKDLSVSKLMSVLDEIFAVDPKTGLPKGDIQYYLSADGNPEVKQWLELNLLQPRAMRGQSMQDVTDDLIIEMSRRSDESPDEYVARLASIRDEVLDNSNLKPE